MNKPETKVLQSKKQMEVQNRPGAREHRRELCSISANSLEALTHNSAWHLSRCLITDDNQTRWIEKDLPLPTGWRYGRSWKYSK